MLRREADVVLPPYRRASYHPDSPSQSLIEVEITPTVMAAAHPEMVSKIQLYRRGQGILGPLRVSEIAKVCNLNKEHCRRILNGQYPGRPNDRLVLATYLQMSLAELEVLIRERRKVALEWTRKRKNLNESREQLQERVRVLERLVEAKSRHA